MEWSKLFLRSKKDACIRDDRINSMQDDINSNTSDCAKMLYRLEEAEAQIKTTQERLQAETEWRNETYRLGHV